MWRQKIETEAKVMKRAKPQVISAVRVGFKSSWMTFSFLKFRLLLRTVNKAKIYGGIILGSILPKNERNY